MIHSKWYILTDSARLNVQINYSTLHTTSIALLQVLNKTKRQTALYNVTLKHRQNMNLMISLKPNYPIYNIFLS